MRVPGIILSFYFEPELTMGRGVCKSVSSQSGLHGLQDRNRFLRGSAGPLLDAKLGVFLVGHKMTRWRITGHAVS